MHGSKLDIPSSALAERGGGSVAAAIPPRGAGADPVVLFVVAYFGRVLATPVLSGLIACAGMIFGKNPH
jgi:hypothetical protein